ncbi:MAG: sigma-70 family RNA polymerase sigma factor [Thermoanaerobaculia bacterium]|nr:sigma-70 family RNA polymerase sigma factor [Thermoanaerobaculia bacterium]
MSARFATTQWSVVLAARDGSDTAARRALEGLCEAYWLPLYVYARRRGFDVEGAADMTQAFFADLIERRALRGVDPEKGRFRSFLLVSFRNFLSHEWDRLETLKRGGGATTVSLDASEAERRFRDEPAAELTPEQAFERRWGLTVMERAMGRLESESRRGDDGPRVFEELRPYLTGADERSYREASDRLSMSEGAVKTAVYRLRKRYGGLLREEIADTVADPGQVDDELRHLLSVIRPLRG